MAIGSKNVYRSAGGKWETLPGPGAAIVNASVGELESTTYIYVTTNKGALFVSEDGEVTGNWRTPALGQQSGRFGTVATAARNAPDCIRRVPQS